MFSLITFLLRLAAEKEESVLAEELENCYGKIVWFREHFGMEPADVDFREIYRQSRNKIIPNEDRKKVLRGESAIDGVILWSLFGWEVDSGKFYLSDDAILFSGKKKELKIRFSDISSIEPVEGAIKIKKVGGRSWRFDSGKLACYGIGIQTLQDLIHL